MAVDMKEWSRRMAEAEAEADAGIAAGGAPLFDRDGMPPGGTPAEPMGRRTAVVTGQVLPRPGPPTTGDDCEGAEAAGAGVAIRINDRAVAVASDGRFSFQVVYDGPPLLLSLARLVADTLAGLSETNREAALASFVEVVRTEVAANTLASRIAGDTGLPKSSEVVN